MDKNKEQRYYFHPPHKVLIFDIHQFDKEDLNTKNHDDQINLLRLALKPIGVNDLDITEANGKFTKEEITKILRKEADKSVIDGKLFVHIIIFLSQASDAHSICVSDGEMSNSELEQPFIDAVRSKTDDFDARLSKPKWFIIQAPLKSEVSVTDDQLNKMYDNINLKFTDDPQLSSEIPAKDFVENMAEKTISVPDRINFITSVCNLPGNIYIGHFCRVMFDFGMKEELNDLIKEINLRTVKSFKDEKINCSAGSAPYYKSSLYKKLYFGPPYGPPNKKPETEQPTTKILE